MIKYCKEQWMKNEGKLKEVLLHREDLNYCSYETLVKLVVDYILNDEEQDENWDSKNITVIDNGDYQGTELYLIPRNTYQPAEYDYLMTYVGYGSCSGCDTLQSIQCDEDNIDDYMTLCRDLVFNMVKPYNNGWRNEDLFDEVKE